MIYLGELLEENPEWDGSFDWKVSGQWAYPLVKENIQSYDIPSYTQQDIYTQKDIIDVWKENQGRDKKYLLSFFRKVGPYTLELKDMKLLLTLQTWGPWNHPPLPDHVKKDLVKEFM